MARTRGRGGAKQDMDGLDTRNGPDCSLLLLVIAEAVLRATGRFARWAEGALCPGGERAWGRIWDVGTGVVRVVVASTVAVGSGATPRLCAAVEVILNQCKKGVSRRSAYLESKTVKD